MACSCAKRIDEYHGWECTIQGGPCIFWIPNSKACAEEYDEGPDAQSDKCEDCNDFYLEDGKRCCKKEPLVLINGEFIKTKFLPDAKVYNAPRE